MGTARKIADFVERQFDVRITRKRNVPLLLEQEHLSRFFKHFDVDCVFDVGANAGQYADMIRNRCGFSGPIISYEPIPALATSLRERSTTARNWHIEQTVLAEDVRTVEFNIMGQNQSSSLNSRRADGPIASEVVTQKLSLQSSTLAIQFAKYKKLIGFKRPFLKMDTQGSDLGVATGAADCLREFVGLQSELSFEPLYANTPGAAEAIEFYRSHGFVLSALVPNNSGQFPQLYEVDCIFYRSEGTA
jgi:FkbM family methyltransferase